MIYLTFEGKTKSIRDWSRCTGINRETIRLRYLKGLPPEQILAKKNFQSKTGKLLGEKIAKKGETCSDCCYPQCFDCKYDDCVNNSPAKPIESKLVKDALKKLPDEGTFEHVHAVGRGIYGRSV